MGLAEWTGLGLRKALRWSKGNELYPASNLIVKILQEHGARSEDDPGSAPGLSFGRCQTGVR